MNRNQIEILEFKSIIIKMKFLLEELNIRTELAEESVNSVNRNNPHQGKERREELRKMQEAKTDRVKGRNKQFNKNKDFSTLFLIMDKLGRKSTRKKETWKNSMN